MALLNSNNGEQSRPLKGGSADSIGLTKRPVKKNPKRTPIQETTLKDRIEQRGGLSPYGNSLDKEKRNGRKQSRY